MKFSYQKLFISLTLPQLAGLIGSAFTFSAIPTWYEGLTKGPLNPPPWIFGPVWTLLYLLMGISLFIIWNKSARIIPREAKLQQPLFIFGIQLILNALWSIIFFGLHSPLWAYVVIILLWLSIVWCIKLFYPLSRSAGWLLIPYLLWVTFASYLNISIWLLN